jgi:hypothetical protein
MRWTLDLSLSNDPADTDLFVGTQAVNSRWS